MSNKARDAYLRLSNAVADLEDAPICSESQYRDWFFPDGFIPTKGMSSAAHMSRLRIMEQSAKQLCNTCPLKALCGEYAILAGEHEGIWGGLSPADRKAIYAFARASKTGEPVSKLLGD